MEWGTKQQRLGLQLRKLPMDRHVFIMPHPDILSNLGLDHPKYLVFKIDGAIPLDLCREILKRWNSLKVFLRPQRYDPNNPRSLDGIFQRSFGKWSHYRKEPYFTRDTKGRSLEEQVAIDYFLALFREKLSILLSSILERYEPGIVNKMIAYVLYDYLSNQIVI